MYEVFVVGNGLSRKQFDLHKLQKFGPIYGCNSLYLDFTPDVLVAYDHNISRKIELSGYSKNNIFYTMFPSQKSGSLHLGNVAYSNSGACSLHLAAMHGFQTVYFLGFDMLDKYNNYSNIYNVNHKKDISFWEPITNVFLLFKNTKFVRVSDLNNDDPKWFEYENYSKIKIKKFNEKYS